MKLLKQKLAVLRTTFDALLVAEVKTYGGIPIRAGRCGAEQQALRDAVADVLAAEDAEDETLEDISASSTSS
jgi:ABC-type enterochelin transport system ATPase subunit